MNKDLIRKDTRLLFTFFTGSYPDIDEFIESCNHTFPGIQMIGGIANSPEPDYDKSVAAGFVFNETMATHDGILLASLSGLILESYTSYATGAQAIGEEFEPGDAVKLSDKPQIEDLFPYVYSDIDDVPVTLSHVETSGRMLRRSFIHDRKIVEDNRALFRKIENFEKAEAIFGYSCVARSKIYSNCAKWELSVYENSNLCGCITGGEIAHADGQNTFANYTFVISVAGESAEKQEFNPYAFSYTNSLSQDNKELLEYLVDVEKRLDKDEISASGPLKSFVTECEQKILYTDDEDIPNAAAMSMDIKVKGYDRIAMIQVPDTSSMSCAFTDHIIQLTYRNFLSKCTSYAMEKGYHIYLIEKWRVAIGAPSYMVSLSGFAWDMENLQRELFESTEELIAIVPTICVIDGCTAGDVESVYNSAKLEMMNDNIQFYVAEAGDDRLDEESIRERYRMVNVINYAIGHDKIIPYFQGIYDNKNNTIHHYESLMRLEDENGRIYYPSEFLDVARSYGLLYDSMSRIMIEKVFNRFRNHENISVSMNLGLRDIKNKNIVDFIYESLSLCEHPENFVFEILENEDLDDYELLVAFVDRVHELGGRISIDDFGSGYSNLEHILNINMDYIKIDGSIVKKCCEDRAAINLIALIMSLREMSFANVSIIAEFVENEQIQDKLLEYGVDYSQGYLFSKPAPDILRSNA